MPASSSLRRRRGTASTTTGRNNNARSRLMNLLTNPLGLLIVMAVFFGSVFGSFFLLMSAEEKKTPVDSFRHKVQAVPNLLRGKMGGPYSAGAAGGNAGNAGNAAGNAAGAGGGSAAGVAGGVDAFKAEPPKEDHFLHGAVLDHVLAAAKAASGSTKKNNQNVQGVHQHPAPPVVASTADHAVAAGAASTGGGSEKTSSKTYPYPLVPTPADYDIHTQYQVLGGKRFTEYASGTAPSYDITDDALRQQSDTVARSRRTYVKRAMEHAWKGYTLYAYGKDEVLPQSKTGSDGWGALGVTLVDSLDTLWLLGMHDEFYKGRDWVRDHLDYSNTGPVSVFETTIRDLGGLLSAYDLSGDQVFLDHALALGSQLIKAYDGSNTGIPFGQVDLRSGHASNIGWTGSNAIFSEFGTTQIENRYLSKMTGLAHFAQKTERVFDVLHEISPANGLFPYYFRNVVRDSPQAKHLRNIKDGGGDNNNLLAPEFTNDKITFGAMGDSTYEYMLKMWLQGGRREPLYREMYDKAIQGMHDELLQTSSPSGLTYIADKNGGVLDHKMDHLVCFMGGSLALGAYTDPLGLQSTRAQRDLKTARALTYTCYQMYARMKTGIAPEFVQFHAGNDFSIGRGAPHYLLRPETVESFFILNQLTGDPIYREWGWEVFQSIEKYCKTAIAYGALSNVQDTEQQPRDKMESFFLAETIKYLYLLQDPDTEIDVLNKHVFNTEAHPLRIFPLIDEEARAGQQLKQQA